MVIKGLTTGEVDERIKKGLLNKASREKTKTINEIFIENIFSMFNFIIFGIIAGIIIFYLKLRDHNLLLDSIGVFTIAFVNTSIAIIQEIKAKRALDKVNLLLVKKITAIRDSKEIQIEQEQIVKDDILFIRRGDQVVVDGSVILSNYLEIDESLLTGESLPLLKARNDKILSGSFCVSGTGYYKAEEIGDESYASNITGLAKKYKFTLTPLQKKLNTIVKLLFISAILLVILEIFNNPIASPDNTHFIRKLATILISLIPQGLILMSSVTFALGVYRISKIGAIVQKLNAIESFSNVKVVCMDKTGTLTKNKLAVEVINFLKNDDKDDILRILKSFSDLSTEKNATISAISEFNFPENDKNNAAKSNFLITKTDEIPFSSETKMSLIQLVVKDKKAEYILGGLDVLAEKLILADDKKFNAFINNEEIKLYRNLLFGKIYSTIEFQNTKEYLDSIKIEPFAIISISDQIREDVLEVLDLFKKNNIDIKILSGDAEYAIEAIVNKIGWDLKEDMMINGNTLDSLNETEFRNAIYSKTIFARLKPEHKLRIIKTLRADKIYTAMIGDGVNDLPAIKEADMGIAMEEGSQITKEISDIILLKNKFSLLPFIFEEGNKIINTVSAVAKLFLTKNFLVIFLSLFSLFFLWDFPLTPRRVSLINIFTIGLPAFIIALKNNNSAKNTKFSIDLFSFVLISAFILTLTSYLGTFFANKYFTPNHEDLQLIMLTTLIFTSVSNFLSVAIEKTNKNKITFMVYGLAIITVYVILVLFKQGGLIIRGLKEFYEINHLQSDYWWMVIIISLACSIGLFIIQKLRSRVVWKEWR